MQTDIRDKRHTSKNWMVAGAIYIFTASQTKPWLNIFPHEHFSMRNVSAANGFGQSQIKFASANQQTQTYLTAIITCVQSKANGSSIVRVLATRVVFLVCSNVLQNPIMGLSGCGFIASYGVFANVSKIQSKINYNFSRAFPELHVYEGNR
jgi:hypothetical protein